MGAGQETDTPGTIVIKWDQETPAKVLWLDIVSNAKGDIEPGTVLGVVATQDSDERWNAFEDLKQIKNHHPVQFKLLLSTVALLKSRELVEESSSTGTVVKAVSAFVWRVVAPLLVISLFISLIV